MDPSKDKQWASKYLLEPLTSAEPNQETGPGSHFGSINKRQTSASYPTPPDSASPSRASFTPGSTTQTMPFQPPPSYRQATFGSLNYGQRQAAQESGSPSSGARSRGNSLGQRFPGDTSNRPLDIIRKQTKAANRSPHLKRQHLPGADIIDSLDKSMGVSYHHEGPYDATLLARNRDARNSPIEAVRGSNAAALKATPREYLRDALDKHLPLQGTAVIPPGQRDMSGRIMEYDEGDDLMRDKDAPGGAYKRWEGVKYLPEDLKGKGEPSFSLEEALKKKEMSRRRVSDGGNSYEMQTPKARPPHHRALSGGSSIGTNNYSLGNSMRYADFESEMLRSKSTGRRVGEGLKRRLGSLRGSKKKTDE